MTRWARTADSLGLLRLSLAVWLTLGAAGSALAQARPREDASTLVRRALDAMGGQTAASRAEATRATFLSTRLEFGEEQRPGDMPPPGAWWGEVVTDWVARRVSATGEHRDRTGTHSFRTIATQTVGYEESFGRMSAAGRRWGEEQIRELDIAPHRILLDAAGDRCSTTAPLSALRPSDLSVKETPPSGRAVRCVGRGTDYTLEFHRLTGRLAAHAEWTDDPIYGRRLRVVRYGEYRPVSGGNGLHLPHLVRVELDGRPQRVTQMDRIEVIASRSLADSVFSPPQPVRARASRDDAIPVDLVHLTRDVYHVASENHFALAVVQGDSIVLVDAPDNAARTRAILDTIRTRLPRTPVRLVVNTQHQADHVGGLPAVFAIGLPVVTHEANVILVRGLARLPGAREAIGGRRVIGVRDSLVIGSGAQELRLYAASFPDDTETALVAYLPESAILFVSDVAEAGRSDAVAALVDRLELRVDRLAPAHGPARKWRDVVPQ